uniref:Uncharacterized protein n=1 Tax=Ditylenchus dipsaci TaxID=166011 RepID=A0A915D423_9BILA
MILVISFEQSLAQNSSTTEIITSGSSNCPAVGSVEYSPIPFNINQSSTLFTIITSISIVPADGAPAIAMLNESYSDPFVVPCQSDHERPNIVLNFQSSDGRQGQWIITPEHWTSTRTPFDAAGTLCEFVFRFSPNQMWYSHDFHARHYCQARNMVDRTLGLASSTIISLKNKKQK